jgi:hypothetical protein
MVYNGVASEDKTFLKYNGLYHEMSVRASYIAVDVLLCRSRSVAHFPRRCLACSCSRFEDVEADRFFNDIVQWLNARTDPNAAAMGAVTPAAIERNGSNSSHTPAAVRFHAESEDV